MPGVSKRNKQLQSARLAKKQRIDGNNDESLTNASDDQLLTKDDHMLVPKSRGAGLMISDFISEQDGFLCLTQEEHIEGLKSYPNLKRYARATLEYGENKDGYWTSDKFRDQLKSCAQIAECKYPKEKGYKVVWVFDNSSCHGAYAEDSLNANRMNANLEGSNLLCVIPYGRGNLKEWFLM